MGRYFGREPRISGQELEAQAKQEIEARVALGRPPAEDWRPIEDRLAELDRNVPARREPAPMPHPQHDLVATATPVGAEAPPG